MKRITPILAVIILGVPVSRGAWGSPVYSQTVTSTEPTAARSTQLTQNVDLVIQCDAAAYVRLGDSAVTVTTATGIKIAADDLLIVDTKAARYVSVLAVASGGTANCKISEDRK